MAEVLTTAEAAALLRCNRRTLQREVARGHLVPIVVNSRRTLYRRADLEAYLAERAVDQAADLAAALQLLAEEHAEEHRPLCTDCGKRRVDRGHEFCMWCEQHREQQREHKLAHYHRTVGPARTAARAAARGTDG